MVALYYVDLAKCEQCNDGSTLIDVSIQSIPSTGTFKNTLLNQSIPVEINNLKGQAHFYGQLPDVVQALYYLHYLPGCILDNTNKL